MKANKFLIISILFSALAAAQDKLPVIKSNISPISIKDGKKRHDWRLLPEAKPDIYEAELIDGKRHKVTYITDVDQISFNVEEGKKYDFIVQKGDQQCYIEIIGTRFIPAATFDKKYRVANKGKTSIEIPEVYELVNVAIALTPTGIRDKNLVYQNSEYYQKVREWFDKYRDHPVLAALDAELVKNRNSYFILKMNGYAFEFDEKGKIVQSKTYDRTGWGPTNNLRPFIAQLQSFADESNFRKFYKQNRAIYDEQIAFYRDTANIDEMKRWLDKNYPKSNKYDSFKIIFSPLVAYSQSTNWFESNGFKELQPHVNFPYPQDVQRFLKGAIISPETEIVYRGNIVFTEINHGYINPEAEKYADLISKATSNRDFWVDIKMGPDYYGGNGAFNEYMNWALVSLRYVDYVPRNEQDVLIADIDRMMTKGRGFLQFEALDKFLVDLYRNRKPNQTIADLYPQIIEWFGKKNADSLAGAALLDWQSCPLFSKI